MFIAELRSLKPFIAAVKTQQYSTQSGSDGIEDSTNLKACVLPALSKWIPSLPLRVLYCLATRIYLGFPLATRCRYNAQHQFSQSV